MQAQQLKKDLLQVFCEMATQKSGFRKISCAAHKQQCVFHVFEF